MHILIFPFAKKLHNGKTNPKNYPHWKELIALLLNNNHSITQIGIEGEEQLVPEFCKNLSLTELAEIINQCDTWIGVDSFGQHFCWDLGKPGIVLWGQSNPKIFGHPENINLLKDEQYLMKDQFLMWELVPYRDDVFVEPEEVLTHVLNIETVLNLSRRKV